MNQHDQMREALRKIYDLVSKGNIHGRWCERCNEDVGSGKPHKDQCLSRYILKLAKQAFAAEPAPLVRLTEDEILECWMGVKGFPSEHTTRGFANAIMDAIIKKNGG